MKLRFKFDHSKIFVGRDDLDLPGTVCYLEDNTGNRVAEGISLVHPEDQFNRAKGRKVAAGKAIHKYVPRQGRRDHAGRAARFDLWSQLFAFSPKTKGA